MAPREDIRRTLADRVASRVAGEGIPRASIEAAVDGVVAALGSRSSVAAPPRSEASQAMPDGATMIAALSGQSSPDLGSRLRAALAGAGVRVAALGIATRGRHTVVTLRLPASARQALERIAAEQSLALSIDPSIQPPA